MIVVFDGRGFADQIVSGLPKKKLKLVTIVDPANEAGMKYTKLKEKMAARLGVEFEIQMTNDKHQIKSKIQNLNRDPHVDGIMIQVPFPGADELIKLIDPKKDVDGLREDSPFKPAVVRAVLEILNNESGIMNNARILVVGSKGFVGRRLIKELGCEGIDKEDFPSSLKLRRASVIISCTGQANLIDGSMVKNGFTAIDVGYPKPEFTPDALAKAGFYTPVPGGVGPVTVACLFANLAEGV